MLFANVCAGFFFFWYGVGWERWVLGFLASPWCLMHLGLVILLVCIWPGSQRCASCWTRPVGGGRWGHCLCYPWRVCWAAQNTACQICEGIWDFRYFKLYMLALVGQPSLHGYDACMVFGVEGAFQRNCRKRECETSFSPHRVFLFSRNSRSRSA